MIFRLYYITFILQINVLPRTPVILNAMARAMGMHLNDI